MPIRIAPLSEAGPADVEALLDAAFGADRRRRTAYHIREGMAAIPRLSFAAFDGGVLTGSLQSWPILIGDAALTLVGPVAVSPDLQQGGIGTLLMDALIAAAPDGPMAMIGDAPYYGRWRFSADATGGWRTPGPVDPARLLARNAEGLPREGLLGPRAFAPAPASA